LRRCSRMRLPSLSRERRRQRRLVRDIPAPEFVPCCNARCKRLIRQLRNRGARNRHTQKYKDRDLFLSFPVLRLPALFLPCLSLKLRRAECHAQIQSRRLQERMTRKRQHNPSRFFRCKGDGSRSGRGQLSIYFYLSPQEGKMRPLDDRRRR